MLLFLLLLVHHGQSARIARVHFHVDSKATSIGVLTLKQRNGNSAVRITGTLCGLTHNTVHGFHVHRDPLLNGELNCTAAGPHFNPYDKPHGPRTANISRRHVGDLGNVTTDDDGWITVNLIDGIIQLYDGTQSIINRTIVLHAMRDDGGTGGFPDSNSTGNAGARIACGVIN